MSIEAGQKYIDKDGEVVEIISRNQNNYENLFNCFVSEYCVWYSKTQEKDVIHVLTEQDFLEQYKPEPVYEYQYAIKIRTGRGNILKIDNLIYYSDEYKHSISGAYYTDNEKKPEHWISYQRLDFTKRERK